MLHEESNRQLLESLDAASRRAQAAFMPAKADIVAIVLGLRGLVVNLQDEVRQLRGRVPACFVPAGSPEPDPVCGRGAPFEGCQECARWDGTLF